MAFIYYADFYNNFSNEENKFIFEYKGKKINTEFLLSEDQSKALQDLIDFTKGIWDTVIQLPKFLCFNNQD